MSKNPLIFLLAGFAGGYTVMNFPKEFLQFFSTPVGRFIAFLSLLYVYYKDDIHVTFADMVLESITFVLILELLGLVLNYIYNK